MLPPPPPPANEKQLGQQGLVLNYELSTNKSWNKPGNRRSGGSADITAWFNYGFNEVTFKQYIQQEINRRTQVVSKIHVDDD
ncbi:Fip1 motif protein [Gregarina niphandrodes]|uniref:Fip1 motif protein n=1 Tax=Gregarina niphandrodes TaxID=110365 RepID=A0A023B4Z6_GRENI|nr:Fip1 motif protein [Gregarina niphandrodes]EZG57858.1 Fip1 motif protein [Gregarina niphandrodes]|eukprot:XP_011131024.1 Fip1 motif protein [Gregarina niphandrodes]